MHAYVWMDVCMHVYVCTTTICMYHYHNVGACIYACVGLYLLVPIIYIGPTTIYVQQ